MFYPGCGGKCPGVQWLNILHCVHSATDNSLTEQNKSKQSALSRLPNPRRGIRNQMTLRHRRLSIFNKSNSTACAEQVEAKLQQQLHDRWHLRKLECC